MHRPDCIYRHFAALCVVACVYLIPHLLVSPAQASTPATETSPVAAGAAIYQPDLMIKTPTDANYQGENIINMPEEQTCSQIASPGSPAVFQLRVQNYGTVQDTFTLTGSAGSDGNSARYFDADSGGQDITAQMTGDGWTSPALSSGACVDLRVEITLDPLVLLATPATFSVTAVSCTDTDCFDTVTAVAFKLPLMSLQLHAASAAMAVNTPVTLTAAPLGGVNVEYKYRLGYRDTAGWHWSDLRGFSPGQTCIWNPAEARSYTVLALAREVGTSVPFQTYASLSLTIRRGLSAVGLSTSPTAPQPSMTPVLLSASASGGVRVEYQFNVGYHDATGWHSVEVQPYSPASSCLWLPDHPRTYLLTVVARESGSGGTSQVTHTTCYKVSP